MGTWHAPPAPTPPILRRRLVAPTALGAYSFSTADGAVLFVWLVWSIFLLPIQARLHRLYNLWMMLVDVGAPALPRRRRRGRLPRGCHPARQAPARRLMRCGRR